jgi:hypothetical protein
VTKLPMLGASDMFDDIVTVLVEEKVLYSTASCLPNCKTFHSFTAC